MPNGSGVSKKKPTGSSTPKSASPHHPKAPRVSSARAAAAAAAATAKAELSKMHDTIHVAGNAQLLDAIAKYNDTRNTSAVDGDANNYSAGDRASSSGVLRSRLSHALSSSAPESGDTHRGVTLFSVPDDLAKVVSFPQLRATYKSGGIAVQAAAAATSSAKQEQETSIDPCTCPENTFDAWLKAVIVSIPPATASTSSTRSGIATSQQARKNFVKREGLLMTAFQLLQLAVDLLMRKQRELSRNEEVLTAYYAALEEDIEEGQLTTLRDSAFHQKLRQEKRAEPLHKYQSNMTTVQGRLDKLFYVLARLEEVEGLVAHIGGTDYLGLDDNDCLAVDGSLTGTQLLRKQRLMSAVGAGMRDNYDFDSRGTLGGSSNSDDDGESDGDDDDEDGFGGVNWDSGRGGAAARRREHRILSALVRRAKKLEEGLALPLPPSGVLSRLRNDQLLSFSARVLALKEPMRYNNNSNNGGGVIGLSQNSIWASGLPTPNFFGNTMTGELGNLATGSITNENQVGSFVEWYVNEVLDPFAISQLLHTVPTEYMVTTTSRLVYACDTNQPLRMSKALPDLAHVMLRGVKEGQLEVVSQLAMSPSVSFLSALANPTSRDTLLYVAVLSGDLGMLRLLLRHGFYHTQALHVLLFFQGNWAHPDCVHYNEIQIQRIQDMVTVARQRIEKRKQRERSHDYKYNNNSNGNHHQGQAPSRADSDDTDDLALYTEMFVRSDGDEDLMADAMNALKIFAAFSATYVTSRKDPMNEEEKSCMAHALADLESKNVSMIRFGDNSSDDGDAMDSLSNEAGEDGLAIDMNGEHPPRIVSVQQLRAFLQIRETAQRNWDAAVQKRSAALFSLTANSSGGEADDAVVSGTGFASTISMAAIMSTVHTSIFRRSESFAAGGETNHAFDDGLGSQTFARLFRGGVFDAMSMSPLGAKMMPAFSTPALRRVSQFGYTPCQPSRRAPLLVRCDTPIDISLFTRRGLLHTFSAEELQEDVEAEAARRTFLYRQASYAGPGCTKTASYVADDSTERREEGECLSARKQRKVSRAANPDAYLQHCVYYEAHVSLAYVALTSHINNMIEARGLQPQQQQQQQHINFAQSSSTIFSKSTSTVSVRTNGPEMKSVTPSQMLSASSTAARMNLDGAMSDATSETVAPACISKNELIFGLCTEQIVKEATGCEGNADVLAPLGKDDCGLGVSLRVVRHRHRPVAEGGQEEYVLQVYKHQNGVVTPLALSNETLSDVFAFRSIQVDGTAAATADAEKNAYTAAVDVCEVAQGKLTYLRVLVSSPLEERAAATGGGVSPVDLAVAPLKPPRASILSGGIAAAAAGKFAHFADSDRSSSTEPSALLSSGVPPLQSLSLPSTPREKGNVDENDEGDLDDSKECTYFPVVSVITEAELAALDAGVCPLSESSPTTSASVPTSLELSIDAIEKASNNRGNSRSTQQRRSKLAGGEVSQQNPSEGMERQSNASTQSDVLSGPCYAADVSEIHRSSRQQFCSRVTAAGSSTSTSFALASRSRQTTVHKIPEARGLELLGTQGLVLGFLLHAQQDALALTVNGCPIGVVFRGLGARCDRWYPAATMTATSDVIDVLSGVSTTLSFDSHHHRHASSAVVRFAFEKEFLLAEDTLATQEAPRPAGASLHLFAGAKSTGAIATSASFVVPPPSPVRDGVDGVDRDEVNVTERIPRQQSSMKNEQGALQKHKGHRLLDIHYKFHQVLTALTSVTAMGADALAATSSTKARRPSTARPASASSSPNTEAGGGDDDNAAAADTFLGASLHKMSVFRVQQLLNQPSRGGIEEALYFCPLLLRRRSDDSLEHIKTSGIHLIPERSKVSPLCAALAARRDAMAYSIASHPLTNFYTNTDAARRQRKMAMLAACALGYTEVVQVLLERIALHELLEMFSMKVKGDEAIRIQKEHQKRNIAFIKQYLNSAISADVNGTATTAAVSSSGASSAAHYAVNSACNGSSGLTPSSVYCTRQSIYTPLHCALLGGNHTTCVTVLLNFLFVALSFMSKGKQRLCDGEDIVLFSGKRGSGAEAGSPVLKANALLHEALNVVTRAGESPLLIATRYSNVRVARRLMRLGASPVCMDRVSRAYCLEIACTNACKPLALKLLNAPNAYATSPVLLNHAGVTTPLCWCALNNLSDMIPLLLAHGASPMIGLDGNLPLLLAVSFGNSEAALALLNHCRTAPSSVAGEDGENGGAGEGDEQQRSLPVIDIDAVDARSQCTPLHIACERGMLKVVQALLKKKASLNVASKTTHFTPLHTAIANDHEDIAMRMVEHAKDQLRRGECVLNLCEINSDGDTTLHLAAKHGMTQLVEYMMSQFGDEEIDRLVAAHKFDNGKRPRAVPYLAANRHGKTPLLLAIQAKEAATAEVIISFTSSAASTPGGPVIGGTCTAALQAANAGLEDVVLLLLSNSIFQVSESFRKQYVAAYEAKRESKALKALASSRSRNGACHDSSGSRQYRSEGEGEESGSGRGVVAATGRHSIYRSASLVCITSGRNFRSTSYTDAIQARARTMSIGSKLGVKRKKSSSRLKRNSRSQLIDGAPALREQQKTADKRRKQVQLNRVTDHGRNTYIRSLLARSRADVTPDHAPRLLLRGFALPELYVMLEEVAAESTIVGIQNASAMLHGEAIMGFLREFFDVLIAPTHVVQMSRDIIAHLRSVFELARAQGHSIPSWYDQAEERKALQQRVRRQPAFCAQVMRIIRLYGCTNNGERALDELGALVKEFKSREASVTPMRLGGQWRSNENSQLDVTAEQVAGTAAETNREASPTVSETAPAGNKDTAQAQKEFLFKEEHFVCSFNYSAMQLAASLGLTSVVNYLLTTFPELSPLYVPPIPESSSSSDKRGGGIGLPNTLRTGKDAATRRNSEESGAQQSSVEDNENSLGSATDVSFPTLLDSQGQNESKWRLTPFRLAVRGGCPQVVEVILLNAEAEREKHQQHRNLTRPSTAEDKRSVARSSSNFRTRSIVDHKESVFVDPLQRTALQEVIATQFGESSSSSSSGGVKGSGEDSADQNGETQSNAEGSVPLKTGLPASTLTPSSSSTASAVTIALVRVLLAYGAAPSGRFDATGRDAWLLAACTEGPSGDIACAVLLAEGAPLMGKMPDDSVVRRARQTYARRQGQHRENVAASSFTALVRAVVGKGHPSFYSPDMFSQEVTEKADILLSLWDKSEFGFVAAAVGNHNGVALSVEEEQQQQQHNHYGRTGEDVNESDSCSSPQHVTATATPCVVVPGSTQQLPSVDADSLRDHYVEYLLFAFAEHNPARLVSLLKHFPALLPVCAVHPQTGDTLLTWLLRKSLDRLIKLGNAPTVEDDEEDIVIMRSVRGNTKPLKSLLVAPGNLPSANVAVAPLTLLSRATIIPLSGDSHREGVSAAASGNSNPMHSRLKANTADSYSEVASTVPPHNANTADAAEVETHAATYVYRDPYTIPSVKGLLDVCMKLFSMRDLLSVLYKTNNRCETAILLAAKVGHVPLISLVVCPPTHLWSAASPRAPESPRTNYSDSSERESFEGVGHQTTSSQAPHVHVPTADIPAYEEVDVDAPASSCVAVAPPQLCSVTGENEFKTKAEIPSAALSVGGRGPRLRPLTAGPADGSFACHSTNSVETYTPSKVTSSSSPCQGKLRVTEGITNASDAHSQCDIQLGVGIGVSNSTELTPVPHGEGTERHRVTKCLADNLAPRFVRMTLATRVYYGEEDTSVVFALLESIPNLEARIEFLRLAYPNIHPIPALQLVGEYSSAVRSFLSPVECKDAFWTNILFTQYIGRFNDLSISSQIWSSVLRVLLPGAPAVPIYLIKKGAVADAMERAAAAAPSSVVRQSPRPLSPTFFSPLQAGSIESILAVSDSTQQTGIVRSTAGVLSLSSAKASNYPSSQAPQLQQTTAARSRNGKKKGNGGQVITNWMHLTRRTTIFLELMALAVAETLMPFSVRGSSITKRKRPSSAGKGRSENSKKKNSTTNGKGAKKKSTVVSEEPQQKGLIGTLLGDIVDLAVRFDDVNVLYDAVQLRLPEGSAGQQVQQQQQTQTQGRRSSSDATLSSPRGLGNVPVTLNGPTAAAVFASSPSLANAVTPLQIVQILDKMQGFLWQELIEVRRLDLLAVAAGSIKTLRRLYHETPLAASFLSTMRYDRVDANTGVPEGTALLCVQQQQDATLTAPSEDGAAPQRGSRYPFTSLSKAPPQSAALQDTATAASSESRLHFAVDDDDALNASGTLGGISANRGGVASPQPPVTLSAEDEDVIFARSCARRGTVLTATAERQEATRVTWGVGAAAKAVSMPTAPRAPVVHFVVAEKIDRNAENSVKIATTHQYKSGNAPGGVTGGRDGGGGLTVTVQSPRHRQGLHAQGQVPVSLPSTNSGRKKHSSSAAGSVAAQAAATPDQDEVAAPPPRWFMYLQGDWAMHAALVLQSPQPSMNTIEVLLFLMDRRAPMSVPALQVFFAASQPPNRWYTSHGELITLRYLTHAHEDSLLHLLVINDQCQVAEYFLAACLAYFARMRYDEPTLNPGRFAIHESSPKFAASSAASSREDSGDIITGVPGMFLRYVIRRNRHGLTAFDYARSASMIQLLQFYGCVPPSYRPNPQTFSRTLDLRSQQQQQQQLLLSLGTISKSKSGKDGFFNVPRIVLTSENYLGLQDGDNAENVNRAAGLSEQSSGHELKHRYEKAKLAQYHTASIAAATAGASGRRASANANSRASSSGRANGAPDGSSGAAAPLAGMPAVADAALLRQLLAAQRTTADYVIPVLLDDDVSLLHLGLCSFDDELVQLYGTGRAAHHHSKDNKNNNSGDVGAEDNADEQAKNTRQNQHAEMLAVLNGATTGPGSDADIHSKYTLHLLPPVLRPQQQQHHAPGNVSHMEALAHDFPGNGGNKAGKRRTGGGAAALPSIFKGAVAGQDTTMASDDLANLGLMAGAGHRSFLGTAGSKRQAGPVSTLERSVIPLTQRDVIQMLERRQFVVFPLALPPPVPALAQALGDFTINTGRRTAPSSAGGGRGGKAGGNAFPLPPPQGRTTDAALFHKAAAARRADAEEVADECENVNEGALLVSLTPMQLAIGAGGVKTSAALPYLACNQFMSSTTAPPKSRTTTADNDARNGKKGVGSQARKRAGSTSSHNERGNAAAINSVSVAVEVPVQPEVITAPVMMPDPFMFDPAMSSYNSVEGSGAAGMTGLGPPACMAAQLEEWIVRQHRPKLTRNRGSTSAAPDSSRAARSGAMRLGGGTTGEKSATKAASGGVKKAAAGAGKAAQQQQHHHADDADASVSEEQVMLIDSIAPVGGVATVEQQALMRVLLKQFASSAGARLSRELGFVIGPNYDVETAGDALAAARLLKLNSFRYANTL